MFRDRDLFDLGPDLVRKIKHEEEARKKAEAEIDSKLQISIVDSGCVISFNNVFKFIDAKRSELFDNRGNRKPEASTEDENHFKRCYEASNTHRLITGSLLALSQKGYEVTSFGPLISITSGHVDSSPFMNHGMSVGGSTSTSIEGFLCTIKKKQ